MAAAVYPRDFDRPRPALLSLNFQPDLGDLQWAEGEIPTPYGMITVILSKTSGEKFQARVRLPKVVGLKTSEATQRLWDVEITQ